MKTLKLLAAASFLLFFATALNAQDKTEVRKVSGFNGIDVSEGIKVELTYGDKEFVEVTADEEYIESVITEVDGSTLEIHLKGNNWNMRNRHILVKVTAKQIEKLEASSGSSIITQNLIETENLKMHVSSGAGLKVAFKATTASCGSSSGANAKLKGDVGSFETDASSGASIHADELQAKKVNADVSSGASISVSVSDELIADASSGGSIRYIGSPKMKDIEKSSGGSVHSK